MCVVWLELNSSTSLRSTPAYLLLAAPLQPAASLPSELPYAARSLRSGGNQLPWFKIRFIVQLYKVVTWNRFWCTDFEPEATQTYTKQLTRTAFE